MANRRTSLRAVFTATLLSSLLLSSLLPGTALAVDPIPTTTSAALEGAFSPFPGDAFTILGSTVRTTPDTGGVNGSFVLNDVTSGTPVEVATYVGCNTSFPPLTCGGRLTVAGRAAGTYQFQVQFTGTAAYASSESPILEVVVAQGTPYVTLEVYPNPVQAHHELLLTGSVYIGDTPVDGGSIAIRDLTTNAIVASSDPGVYVQTTVTPSSVGVHGYRAEWSGNTRYAAGMASLDVTVVSDVVQATGVGTNYTVFYPVVDGYRDSVTARGTRQEAAGVTIYVRTSGGSLVRKVTIPSGTGAYSWAWNGKNAAGTLLGAGTYKISQVLKDAAGTTKTFITPVTLSRKKLYWYSTDLYKTSAQTQKKTGSWGAWLFTMPSATAYRSMRLYVYGKHNMASTGHYGAQDIRRCSFASFGPGCVGHFGSLPGTLAWVSIPLSPTYDHSGRYVRAYVEATSGGISVGRLRLHLQYGILK